MVNTTIREQIGLLKGMAALQSLDNKAFEAFRSDAQRVWEMHPEWRTVILTDESKPVFNLRIPPGKPLIPLRDPDSLKKVWETKRSYVGNLSHGFVAIRIPVFREKRVVYSLVAPTAPSFFQDKLYAAQESHKWSFIIVGSDDVVITASKDVPLKTGDRVAQSVLEKEIGKLVSKDIRQAAPVNVVSSGWRITIFAPSDIIEAPFVIKRRVVVLAGITAVALTTILILFLSASWAEKRETRRLRKEVEERKRIQDELSRNEKRFRSLVENAPDAIFVNTNGRFAYVNDAALALFGAGGVADLVDQPVMERFHPNCRDEINEHMLWLYQAGKKVPLMSWTVLRLDGASVGSGDFGRAL